MGSGNPLGHENDFHKGRHVAERLCYFENGRILQFFLSEPVLWVHLCQGNGSL